MKNYFIFGILMLISIGVVSAVEDCNLVHWSFAPDTIDCCYYDFMTYSHNLGFGGSNYDACPNSLDSITSDFGDGAIIGNSSNGATYTCSSDVLFNSAGNIDFSLFARFIPVVLSGEDFAIFSVGENGIERWTTTLLTNGSSVTLTASNGTNYVSPPSVSVDYSFVEGETYNIFLTHDSVSNIFNLYINDVLVINWTQYFSFDNPTDGAIGLFVTPSGNYEIYFTGSSAVIEDFRVFTSVVSVDDVVVYSGLSGGCPFVPESVVVSRGLGVGGGSVPIVVSQSVLPTVSPTPVEPSFLAKSWNSFVSWLGRLF